MEPSEIVYALLKRFTSKNRYHLVSYYEFVKFFLHYMESDDSGRFDLFSSNTADVITAQLILLEKKGKCSLEYDGQKITSISFDEYFMGNLLEKYKKVELSAEEPFPSEESCGFTLPYEMVVPVDVKNDFIALLQRDDLADLSYIRIKFPEDIKDVLITGPLLKDRLLLLCFQRLQVYLNSKNNANYLFRKLVPVLQQSEQSIQDTLNKAKSSPTQMAEQVKRPSEVSFPFWAQVSNFIIKELKDKTDKLTQEHTFCQCAYLIGYMNIYYRDKMHREKDRVNALNSLGDRIRKPPYAYSLFDIMGFKDGKTALMNNKFSKEDLLSYLEERTKPQDEALLPEIIRLRTGEKKEFYIHRDIIVPLTYKKVNDAHDHYRKELLDSWEEQLKNYLESPEMSSDEAFLSELEKSVRKEDPLLEVLLNYDLLYLAIKQNPRAPMAEEVRGYINAKHNTLFPLDEILRLKRKELLALARRGLPLWRGIPVLSAIIIFFKKAFGSGGRKKAVPSSSVSREVQAKIFGGKEAEESLGKNALQQKMAYKQRVFQLKEAFAGKGADLDKSLAEMAEAWNPLYDPQAKANLVEDVNSLTRDYLRKLKRGLILSPPDEERIRNMARLLGENKGLDKIKKKELLIRYLELYIIKLLQQVK